MNKAIMAHFQQHKIYMNPTEIKQVEAIVARFFVFSHIKYHSWKDAAAELITRAFIEILIYMYTRFAI
eukprot:2222026-Ditylum_brightwellii.AAC.1